MRAILRMPDARSCRRVARQTATMARLISHSAVEYRQLRDLSLNFLPSRLLYSSTLPFDDANSTVMAVIQIAKVGRWRRVYLADEANYKRKMREPFHSNQAARSNIKYAILFSSPNRSYFSLQIRMYLYRLIMFFFHSKNSFQR